MGTRTLRFRLWRQAGPGATGAFEDESLPDADAELFFLDALDRINAARVAAGKPAIAFDYACRNGKCGQCSLVVNGRPHGPPNGRAICQTKLGEFAEVIELMVEPFRSTALPVKQDLSVDRLAMEALVEAGGFQSVPTSGGFFSMESGMYHHPDGDPLDACIRCGACVAGCPNGSAALFVGVLHRRFERLEPLASGVRARSMVAAMDERGFGACGDLRVCEAVCPKGITLERIGELNRAWRSGRWWAAEVAGVEVKVEKD